MADDIAERADELLHSLVGPGEPGCAVGVIQAGEWVLRRAVGLADVEAGRPLTTATPVYIASTGKQFVAACALLLDEQGRLSLDQDVRDFEPRLPWYGAPITVRHLVHHTSGLRDFYGLAELSGRASDSYSDDELIDLVARQEELNAPPGTAYHYSNTGYLLLARIAAAAAGEPLPAYAHKHVFAPLGMASTQFAGPADGTDPEWAKGYQGWRGRFVEARQSRRIGPGGVVASVDDMREWDANFEQGTVGGPHFARRLTEPGRLADGTTVGYAAGLRLGRLFRHRTVMHGGLYPGFGSHYLRIPSKRLSIVCFANRDGLDPTFVSRRLAQLLLHPDHRSRPVPPTAASGFLPSGVYWDPAGDVLWEMTEWAGTPIARLGTMGWALKPAVEPAACVGEGPAGPIVVHAKGRPLGSRLVVQRAGAAPVRLREVPRAKAAVAAGVVGTYRGPEVDGEITVEEGEGGLVLHRPGPHTAPLVRLDDDVLGTQGLRLTFERDAEGRVTACRVTIGAETATELVVLARGVRLVRD